MPQTAAVHAAGDTVYAQPVLREPSPAVSLSSEYQDETSAEDRELDDGAFAAKMEEKIRLSYLTEQEERANESPLIFPRPASSLEEQGKLSFHAFSSLCAH